jgi:catechol 2,3-dioxygenase-like lactoylglutathione lyase family enzyme
MQLHHVSIPVPPGELDSGRRFYRDLFGLEEIPPRASLGPERVVWFALGDRELHLFMEEHANARSSRRHLAFAVDDLDAVRERLGRHGVEIEEAEPIHNRPRFFCRDPFGNLLEVTTILGPYA